MKKVLFLIHDLEYGGAERVLVNLVNNMDRSEFDITVMSLFSGGVNEKYLNSDIRYITCFKKAFPGNSTLMKFVSPELLHRLFIKDKYDIEISYLEGPCARIVSGCPDKNTKLVSWIHIELYDDYDVGFLTGKAATKAYLKMNNIVCVSETVQKAFEQSAGINFPNIQVLYNTNETAQILERSKEKIDDVVFSKDEFNIVSVAKLCHPKGYDRLIKALGKLKVVNPELHTHLYLLGIGSDKEKLERLADDSGVRVSFLGYKDNPYKYVAACDLYVCSSRQEGFSTAVTEALIVGTPVVSTDCSGARELLGDSNEYGIVVENSEEGIYSGIKKMLDGDTLTRYRRMAKARGAMFSKEKTVKAVEEMLFSLYE